ncbi:MAG TPA: ABC transporter ATP-binding protein [Planctomycetes bacterium]|nr:ABC transporter ATP-binding protein [Planctomycetota bacterium]
MTPAIQVRELAKNYGEVPALGGVSFEVAQGEFFGLLGPNGAGKSTTLNILAGLTRPSSGFARVMGYDVVSQFRLSRRNLGVVPQEVSTDRLMSIWKTLKIQAGLFGVRKPGPWIEELLQRLYLWEHRNKLGHELSGGMKRRLLVAKALVHKPPVVILDEPTAGVDVELRREFWAFIREIHAAGTTILLTTHYLDEAEDGCERIGILGRGQILALEKTEDLLKRHSDRELRLRFEKPLPQVPLSLREFSAQLLEGGRVLSLRTKGKEDREAFWRRLADLGIAPVDVEVKRPDLEDVFLELTRGRGERQPKELGV